MAVFKLTFAGLALGLRPRFRLFKGTECDILADGSHLTRAIHYPPIAHAPSAEYVWADAHTDINLVTALPRATTRGLQLRTPEGWLDVVPPVGHVVVNSGIMLERLSNGRIPAGVHRVVASGGAGSANDVRSVLDSGGADAALVAGILHDDVTTIREIKRLLAGAGLPVREVA